MSDTPTFRVPFNRVSLQGNEIEYLRQAVEGGWTAGDGPFTRRCNELLERELGVADAWLTTSCTHALEMAALLLDVQAGDEIIVPAFTFVSTVNAFVLRGAKPVFVDVRRDTLNLDEELIEARVTQRTKAIVPVHYAGVGCEMERIVDIASRRGVAVVEDNAHGLFAKYRGRWLGTFGALAAQSFHETKNFGCGEGGALLVNDRRYSERAEILREKGTNRSRYFRGQVDKYTWVDVGSSYLPADLLAAFLYAQLESWQRVQAKRRHVWERYDRELADWRESRGVRGPIVPADREQSYHMYYLILPSLEARQSLIAHLRAQSILAVFHYLPLHLSEMGRRFGGRAGDCPVTEDVSDRLLRLPFYNDLSQSDQQSVIDAIRRWPG